jgi:shikimate dehydrogenase
MEKTDAKQFRFGLLGKNISYSFSRGYFSTKFSELKLPNYSYENFDLQDISEFTEVLKDVGNLTGLNVTIPYKETIIPYLTELEPSALEIGAVNTIKISGTGL